MSAADALRAELGPEPKKAQPRRTNGHHGESAFDLANRVSTTQILDRYGIEHDGETFADCPGCAEPKAKLCGGGVKCLHNRCADAGPPGKAGFRTPVDIVAERERVEPLEAATLICSWYGIELPKSRERTPEPPPDHFDDWQPSDDDAPDAPPRSTETPAHQGWPTINVAGIFAALEPVNFLVGPLDLCAGAPGLFAGYGYSGKTLAAQSMALAISSGSRLWGAFDARKGRVLHVDYEQGQRLSRERYQRLAVGLSLGPSDLGDRLELVSMPPVYLDGSGLEDFLSERLAGFDLAIIDSLKAACPTIEENDSSVRRVLDCMTRASERTGCAVVVIHHARKPSRDAAGGAKMAIRGSGAIFDACGSVLVFEAEKGQPTRVSHEKARVSGRLVEDFLLQVEDVEVGRDPRAGVAVLANVAPSRDDAAEDAAAQRRRARAERAAAELRSLFEREPEQGGADSMATKLGRKVTDVRAALALLVERGEVSAVGTSRDRRHRWVGRE